MKQTHDFLPGDRITLLYPGVGANCHTGTITQVTPASVSVQVEGLSRPKRFFSTRNGQWVSNFGHLVFMNRVSAEPSVTVQEKPLRVSTYFS